MPSLNVSQYIDECVKSVVNQTLSDIEIICIDAGSTDGTLEILEKYSKDDDRIKLIQTDKKSYGYQVNLGISEANGEYIGIVETDDFIDEKMYETLYGMTNNGQADMAKVNFYHYHDLKENPKVYVSQVKKNVPTDEFFTVYDDANILNGHPSIWAAIYKKSFLTDNNIKFMEAPGGGWVDNPFLFETALLAESIIYNHEPFYFYRELNPDSSTNNMKDLTLAMERMINNFDILDKYSCRDEDILEMLYIRIFWHIHDILKKDNFNEQKDELLVYFNKVLSRVDENIVKERFKIKDQKIYYKYLSPLNILNFEGHDSVSISKEDYDNILKENDFLYSRISSLERKNRRLNKKNKTITNSKTYKIGSVFTKPIKSLKRK